MEREQETKDLEVKLFESSLAGSSLSTFDDEPLPAQRNTNRSLFPESAPAAATPAPVAQTPGRQAIADRWGTTKCRLINYSFRYKGSSIAFDYAPSPPLPTRRAESFKTPQIQRRSVQEERRVVQEEKPSGQAEGGDEAKRLQEVIRQNEGDIGGLRLELASAQSELEQLKKGRGGAREDVRAGAEVGKLTVELEKEKGRVVELGGRLAKVQQEAETRLHNSEAARTGMEAKLKAQEKELRTEVGEAVSEAARLGKQVEEQEKRLEQEGKAARLNSDSLTAQLGKTEVSKR